MIFIKILYLFANTFILQFILAFSAFFNKVFRFVKNPINCGSTTSTREESIDSARISPTCDMYTYQLQDKKNNSNNVSKTTTNYETEGEGSSDENEIISIPDWAEKPRDASTLPEILQGTNHTQSVFREISYREMLKVLESLDPDTDMEFFRLIFDKIDRWAKDEDEQTRHQLLDPLPSLFAVTRQIDGLSEYADKSLSQFLLNSLTTDREITRLNAVGITGILLERHLLSQDALKNGVISKLFDLAECRDMEPRGFYTTDRALHEAHSMCKLIRTDAIQVVCRVISCEAVEDKQWLYQNYLKRFSHFLSENDLETRKATISTFGELAKMFGEKFTENFVVPHMLHLADESNWGVRKAICEIFVQVATYAPKHVRATLLAQRYCKLLHDPSRWVGFLALEKLGPFIATFANSSITGLEIKDGSVYETELSKKNGTDDDTFGDRFGILPSDCYMPDDGNKTDDEADSSTEEKPANSSILNDLHNVLDKWVLAQRQMSQDEDIPNTRKRSALDVMDIETDTANYFSTTNVNTAAGKCSSLEDLTKFGLDTDEVSVDMYDDEYEDTSGDSDELNTTLMAENCADENIEEEKSQDENDTKEAVIEPFSPVAYWSTGYEAFGFDDEELKAFGTSDEPLEKSSFLEKRMDVLYVSPKKTSSPIRNQKEKAEINGTSSIETSMKHVQRAMKFEADIGGYREEKEEKETEERIVPQELVDNFMAMVSKTGSGTGNEDYLNRHCAHNFPAVAYTLGRQSWPQLRTTYTKLANDDQCRVRVSIANSIHEMAKIVGSQSTDDDLLPVFNSFREDVPEVRVGVLRNLFEFYKCLTPDTRKMMIDILPQFMPMDNSMLHGMNWRFRLEFAKQCKRLCDLYGVEEINRTMSAIALTLANDRVADVRKEAVLLLSLILGRLVNHEWNEKGENESNTDGPSSAPLTELFVQDLVNGFAKTQKWTRRQTFAALCERVLLDETLKMDQFRYFLLPHLSAMGSDSVANVRIAVTRALSRLPSSLQSAPLMGETIPPVSTVLNRLVDDDDMDVARSARYATGKQYSRETVEIDLRGFRITQKEDSLLCSRREKDNYEDADMSIVSSTSPNKSNSES